MNSRPVRAVFNFATTSAEGLNLINTREAHAAQMPFGNGLSNARSMAKMYAACIGEIDGVRLLTPATVERVRESQDEAHQRARSVEAAGWAGAAEIRTGLRVAASDRADAR